MGAAHQIQLSTRADTLYDALGVQETASVRQVRNVAKAIRRDTTTAEDFLHDVCLAEEVLGDPAARAEYDRLLGRLRAAGVPHPKIGVAIEGARLGPSLTTRVGAASLAGARVGGRILKGVVMFGFAIGILILIAIGIGSKGSRSTSYKYEPIKIHIPEFRPPVIDYSKLYVPPKIDYSKLYVPPPRIDLEKYTPKPKPRPRVRTPKPKRPPVEQPSTRVPSE